MQCSPLPDEDVRSEITPPGGKACDPLHLAKKTPKTRILWTCFNHSISFSFNTKLSEFEFGEEFTNG